MYLLIILQDTLLPRGILQFNISFLENICKKSLNWRHNKYVKETKISVHRASKPKEKNIALYFQCEFGDLKYFALNFGLKVLLSYLLT